MAAAPAFVRHGLGAVFLAVFRDVGAAAYEIIEWQYAVREGGSAGIEFLGSQGDVWDAQKDMLADTLGALAALVLFVLVRPDRSGRYASKRVN